LLVHVKKYDIYLPLQYNNGGWIEDEKFEQTRNDLLGRFGGLTYIMREFPLRGIWGQDNKVYQDFIIIYRKQARKLPRRNWECGRGRYH